ncbi:MAG: DUF4118 domain-containing protein [Actinocatenispora sp.]
MARYWAARPITRWLSGLLVSVVMVAAMSAFVAILDPFVPGTSFPVLYLLVVMATTILWGTGLGIVAAVLSIVAFEYSFVSPTQSFRIDDPRFFVAAGVFLVTAVVVGQLTARLRRNAQEAERLVKEQSALRRVATLTVRSVTPSEVFEAVTREVGLLCDADLARMERYEQDGTVTGVALWSRAPTELAVGTRLPLEGPSIARAVRQTGGPTRIDSFAGATGAIAQEAREVGIRSSVGCPIVVAGRLWGLIAASTRSAEPFPPNAEAQITAFTEIIATAIANAESRAQLAASRARVITAGDDMRQRLERNLHDGVQQRLVSLGFKLRLSQDAVPAELATLRDSIDQATAELNEAIDDLREITRGIHPAILSEGGIGSALRGVARRAAIPVELHLNTRSRYPPPVEVAAYYLVSEAVTNTTKHARASYAEVVVEERAKMLCLAVRDDGVGGAQSRHGSGLTGLRDRVEAIGGSIDIASPAGQGTVIRASFPLESEDPVS